MPSAESRSIARLALERRMSQLGGTTIYVTARALRYYANTSLDGETAPAPWISRTHPRATPSRLRDLLGTDHVTKLVMASVTRANDDRVPSRLFDLMQGDDVVTAAALMLEDGPRRAGRRTEAMLHDYAHDPLFRPALGRRGQNGRARGSVDNLRGALIGLCDKFVTLRADFRPDERPAVLDEWRRQHNPALPVGVDGRREDDPVARLDVVQTVLERLDSDVSTAFWRRYGISDLEVVARSDLEAPPGWVEVARIVMRARNRAMIAFDLTTALRVGHLRLLNVGHWQPDLELRPSALGFELQHVGAAYLPSFKEHPGETKPVCEWTRRWIDVWLWIYRAIMRDKGLELQDHHPLFPARGFITGTDAVEPTRLSLTGISSLFTGYAAKPSGPYSGGIALIPNNPLIAGKTRRELRAEGIDLFDETTWRGPGGHGMRRLSERIIVRYGPRWLQQREPVELSSAIKTTQIKEALLGHSKIPDDLLGYSGLSKAPGRQLLSLLGSEIIEAALFGDLALPRGPDERHLREALLVIRGLRDQTPQLERDIEALDRRLFAGEHDATAPVRDLFAALTRDRQLRASQDELKRWEQRAHELEDRRNWIALRRGETAISTAHLRETILAVTPETPETQKREILTRTELRRAFQTTDETIRRWGSPTASDRSRPWPADAPPIIQLDQKTPLYWVGGFNPKALANPERAEIIAGILRTDITGPGWDPGGPKQRKLAKLGPNPTPEGIPRRNNTFELSPHP